MWFWKIIYKSNKKKFNYVKALWKRALKLGLTKLKLLDSTKILIFSLKIYPYIQENKKEEYIKDVYDQYLPNNIEYKSFIKYFKYN